MPSLKRDSLKYTIGFAAVVCLICGVFVATSAVMLRPLQERNQVVDRLGKILEVANLMKPGETLPANEVMSRFAENVVPRVIDLQTGAYDDSVDATSYDQRKAARDPQQSTRAPANEARVLRLPNLATVYHVMKGDQLQSVVLPIQGYGLWSTLYGYLALQADGETIAGITFYEHGETPGLGGEIENPRWQALWPGRKAFAADGQVKIRVIKGSAGSPQEDPHRVDGLSGATITSRGVSNTLDFWLGKNGFGPYLKKLRDGSAR